jgi:hypothetical protein
MHAGFRYPVELDYFSQTIIRLPVYNDLLRRSQMPLGGILLARVTPKSPGQCELI